jgi:hypothetical protein
VTDQKEQRRPDPSDGSGERRARQRSGRDGKRRVNALGASRRAAAALDALIGRPVEGVVEVTRDGDGWLVAVEVLEIARVPNTNDVLGVYEVDLDPYGSLQGYRRRNRYTRGSTDAD